MLKYTVMHTWSSSYGKTFRFSRREVIFWEASHLWPSRYTWHGSTEAAKLLLARYPFPFCFYLQIVPSLIPYSHFWHYPSCHNCQWLVTSCDQFLQHPSLLRISTLKHLFSQLLSTGVYYFCIQLLSFLFWICTLWGAFVSRCS